MLVIQSEMEDELDLLLLDNPLTVDLLILVGTKTTSGFSEGCAADTGGEDGECPLIGDAVLKEVSKGEDRVRLGSLMKGVLEFC